MDQRSLITSTLADVTAGWRPAEAATVTDLHDARVALARSLVAGQPPESLQAALHAPASPGASSGEIARVADRVLAEPPAQTAPLAFVRALPAAEGVARTAASWANGMAANESFGPFVDGTGVRRWIDLISIKKTFAVVRAPGNAPLCLLQIEVPLIAPAAPTVSGTLGAGSLWLVVKAFASAAPADAFAGLAFSGGKVTISGPFAVVGDTIELSAVATLTLELAPVPAPAAAAGTGAGGDFRNSSMLLPASLTFTFEPTRNALTALSTATLDVYGSAASFAYESAPAVYNAPLALLGFSCSISPTTFGVTQRSSNLFPLAGNATVAGAAYALPVALTTASMLGAAASGGYLSLAVGGGLAATLNDAATPTPFNGAIVLRTATTLVVFANAAVTTFERYELWDGRSARASSLETTVAQGATVAFVSGSAVEFTLEDAAIVAKLDRPIVATGAPLPIAFANALVAIVLTNAPATLIVFAAQAPLAGSFPLALENAYLAVGEPVVLELVGRLQGNRVASGALALLMPATRLLPTLPDPYLARYFERGDIAGAVNGIDVAAFVRWADPSSAQLAFTLVQAPGPQAATPVDAFAQAIQSEGISGAAALLDVSTNADLLGVFISETAGAIGFDGIALAALLDRVLLFAVPQISWEPLLTPNSGWGFISPDDGQPLSVLVPSTQAVRFAPSSVFDIDVALEGAAGTRASLTLPFGIEATVDTTGVALNAPLPAFVAKRPTFGAAKGGRQLAIVAGNVDTVTDAALPGSSQANAYGVSVLGGGPSGVGTFYNEEFAPAPSGKAPRVPVARYDISGYGASLFSDWFATDADPEIGIATARFDVSVGRTIFEVVQAKSYIYPWAIPVVETVTMVRESDGSVVRIATGWRAVADGTFAFGNRPSPPNPPGTPNVPPAQIQLGPLVGLFDVRNIQTTSETASIEGGAFTYQKVLFDADVRLTDVGVDPSGVAVVSGATPGIDGKLRFASRGIAGWLQTSVGDASTIAELEQLLLQQGTVPGPLAGVIDAGRNGTLMTVTQFDASLSPSASAGPSIVAAVRGMPHLPRDGSWSVSRRSGSLPPTALDPQSPIPLVRPNGTAPWQMAEPSEVGALANTFYGLLQSTGTQKSLYESPQIAPGGSGYTFPQVPKLADVGALLGLGDIFPDLGSALKPPSFAGLDVSGDGLKTTIPWSIGTQPGDAELIHPGRKLLDFGPVQVYLAFTSDPTVNPPPATGSAVTLVLDPTASSGPDGRWSFRIEGLCAYVLVTGASSEFDPLLYITGDFFVSEKTKPGFANLNVQFGSAMSVVQGILTALTDIASTLPGGHGTGLTVTFAGSTLSIVEGFTLPTIPLGFGEIENVGMNIGASIDLLKKQLSFQVAIGSPQSPVTWSYFPLAGNGCVVVAANENGLGVLIQAGLGIGLTIDVAVASGSASIIFAVQVNATVSPFDIKAMLIGNAQVDVLGGLASASLTLTAALDIQPLGGGSFDLTASVAVAIHISICWVISVDFDGSWSMSEQLNA